MSIVQETVISPDTDYMVIDWDKVTSVDDIKTVLIGLYGIIGAYTSDPGMLKFKKDTNE